WHDVNEGREPYMKRLVERILQDPQAPEHDYYFDVLSLHIYFRTQSVYDIVHEMRQMLDANGLVNKRIWINETNAAPTDDPDWPVERPVFQLDLQHQAAFLVQSAALGLAAGAERIAAYKLYDQQLLPGGESFGLLNPASAAPRPAFAAWAMVTQHFDHVIGADYAQTEQVEAVRLHHANLQQTVVLWARTEDGATASIEATGNKAYRIALDGTITVLRPDDGMYDIQLSPALCEEGEGCYLGGTPVLLVQPDEPGTLYDMTTDEIIPLVFEQE
ncbi:MAG: hypothetical protein KC496_04035, partial [Anaerolineae bacterium]|nr:hypothetical protein [Anaerolineae bacterium]